MASLASLRVGVILVSYYTISHRYSQSGETTPYSSQPDPPLFHPISCSDESSSTFHCSFLFPVSCLNNTSPNIECEHQPLRTCEWRPITQQSFAFPFRARSSGWRSASLHVMVGKLFQTRSVIKTPKSSSELALLQLQPVPLRCQYE